MPQQIEKMVQNSQFQCPSHVVDPLHASKPDVVLSGLTDTRVPQAFLDLLLKDIAFGDLDIVGQATIPPVRCRRRGRLIAASPVHRDVMIVISYAATFARTVPDFGRLLYLKVCSEKCRQFSIMLVLVLDNFVEARRNRRDSGSGETWRRAWHIFILTWHHLNRWRRHGHALQS